ncbi:MAG TPA: hypothetical protein VGH19_08825 [Verrucomicrobiae bacterium]
MKHSFTILIAGILTAAGLITGLRVAEAADQPTRTVMQVKLVHAQGIMEGIAKEDFQKIGGNAQKLVQLSQGTGWYARQTPEYELFTMEFRRHAETLVKAAKDQNIDAATGAYMQMTVSCVSCHKYMRGAKPVVFSK